MAVSQWYVYRSSDGKIVNKIEYDNEVDQYQPPEGHKMVESVTLKGKWSMCGIGWTYKDGNFIEPTKK